MDDERDYAEERYNEETNERENTGWEGKNMSTTTATVCRVCGGPVVCSTISNVPLTICRACHDAQNTVSPPTTTADTDYARQIAGAWYDGRFSEMAHFHRTGEVRDAASLVREVNWALGMARSTSPGADHSALGWLHGYCDALLRQSIRREDYHNHPVGCRCYHCYG